MMAQGKLLLLALLATPALVASFVAPNQHALVSSSSTLLQGTLEDAQTAWGVDETYTMTESGLQYKDVSEGQGDSPSEEGTIYVHYKIIFDEFDEKNQEGKVYFDSRKGATKQEPLQLQYGVTQIVKGWQEGMATMKAGGKRTLIVPSELGYGEVGIPAAGTFPAIPAFANLRFELELVEVDNSPITKFRRMIPKPSAIFDAKKSWFS